MKWPVGVGGKGNEGVAGLVKQTPGSIGYVELIYALQNKIAYGAVQNAAGKFVEASIPAVTAAAAAAGEAMPADFRVSITNAPGEGVYPISSFTWLLLYENPKDKAQGKAMVEFMKWALTDGQKIATDLGYAPLPAEVVKLEHGGAGDASRSRRAPCAAGSGDARSRLQARHGLLRGVLVAASSLGIGVRAVAAVDAVDREVRLRLLARRRLGSGVGRVRRAPFI